MKKKNLIIIFLVAIVIISVSFLDATGALKLIIKSFTLNKEAIFNSDSGKYFASINDITMLSYLRLELPNLLSSQSSIYSLDFYMTVSISKLFFVLPLFSLYIGFIQYDRRKSINGYVYYRQKKPVRQYVARDILKDSLKVSTVIYLAYVHATVILVTRYGHFQDYYEIHNYFLLDLFGKNLYRFNVMAYYLIFGLVTIFLASLIMSLVTGAVSWFVKRKLDVLAFLVIYYYVLGYVLLTFNNLSSSLFLLLSPMLLVIINSFSPANLNSSLVICAAIIQSGLILGFIYKRGLRYEV